MNEERPRPEEASDEDDTSEIMFLDPGQGTDRLDVEEVCSAVVASSL